MMSDDFFNIKNTSFWGFLTAFFWALPKILEYRKQQKTQKIHDELEKALNKENKMSEKKDIKDVMEILDFGFSGYSFIKELFKDGKLHFEAVALLMPLYPKAQAAYDNAGQAIPQLADLDASESAQLVAFVVSKGVADEHAAAIISKSLNVGVSLIELIKEINNEPKVA
jgi:hypothetical protein